MSATTGHTQTAAGRDRRSLLLVLGLSCAILAIELVGGIAANSLALLADAGHVFTDVAGITLALGAMWIAGRAPSDARTFGWYRAEILAAAIRSPDRHHLIELHPVGRRAQRDQVDAPVGGELLELPVMYPARVDPQQAAPVEADAQLAVLHGQRHCRRVERARARLAAFRRLTAV